MIGLQATAPAPQATVRPVVWAVLLNWNGLDDTLACLALLTAIDTDGFELAIVVVDNGSAVDPRPAISERFPAVNLVCSEQNLGFAAGCNLGAELAMAAGADYVLLLNNDTLVAPDFLRHLLAFVRQQPGEAVLSPLICYADQPGIVWFAGARAIPALGLFGHRYIGQPRGAVPPAPFATAYATGCCMLIPASLLRRIGPLEAAFFAYYEDVDFSLRARRAGAQIVCVPASLIWHKESASTRRGLTEGNTSPFKHFLLTRNRIATVLRHGSPLEQAIYLLLALPITADYFILAFLARRRWKKLVWMCRGIVDGLQGRFVHPGM